MAESGFTLPAFSLFALCLWRPWAVRSVQDALPVLVLLLTCYILMEWCNRRQVIRVRSRLTTSIFVLGASVMCTVMPLAITSLCIALGLMCSLLCLTACYDVHEPVVSALHIAFSLSLVSLLAPPVLWLLPVLCFCLVAYMRVFTMRMFSAMLMGTLLPWLFVATWQLWVDDFTLGHTLWTALFSPPASTYSPYVLYPWAAVTLLGAVSLIHFLSNSYSDKIRVRMIFYCVIVLWVAMQAIILLYPAYMPLLLPALWLLTCPLVAHHLALSSSWWTMLWFVVNMLLLLCGAIFSLVI